MTRKYVLGVVFIVLVIVLAGAVLSGRQALAQQGGTALSGDWWPTYTLLEPTRLQDEIVYTRSPTRRWQPGGLDMSLTKGWGDADVFVNAVGEGDWRLVSSVELSPDGIHWAPLLYEQTQVDSAGSKFIGVVPPIERTLSPAAGAAGSYFRVKLAGQYIRVKLDATGIVTPTVDVTYRKSPRWP